MVLIFTVTSYSLHKGFELNVYNEVELVNFSTTNEQGVLDYSTLKTPTRFFIEKNANNL